MKKTSLTFIGTVISTITVNAMAQNAVNSNQLSDIYAFTNDEYVILGKTAKADGSQKVTSIGHGTNAIGARSTAIGHNATSKGNQSVAIGTETTANDQYSVAIGGHTRANGLQSISVGFGTVAEIQSVAIGGNATKASKYDVTIGNTAKSNHQDGRSVTIGVNSTNHADRSVLLGGFSTNKSGSGFVGGYASNIRTEARRNFILGSNSNIEAAVGADNLVLGSGITIRKASTTGSVILGVSSSEEGSHEIETVTNASVGGLTYGNFAGAVKNQGRFVSVGAKGDERKIINVAAGQIAPNSTEAVNGSQLYSAFVKFAEVNNELNELNKKIKSIGALSAAAAALPQVMHAGKSMVSVSTGSYKGVGALAIGFSRANSNGNVVLKLNASIHSSDAALGAGVGYTW